MSIKDNQEELERQRRMFPNSDFRGTFDREFCKDCDHQVEEIDFCFECEYCNDHCGCDNMFQDMPDKEE